MSSEAGVQSSRVEVEDGQKVPQSVHDHLRIHRRIGDSPLSSSRTSAQVFSIHATYSRSLASGHGFPVSHTVACVVAACSSSAAANMVILFTLVDDENRRSAVVTRCRTVIASKRH